MKNICLSFPVPPVPERTVWSALCARPTRDRKNGFCHHPFPRPGEQEGVDYYYRTKEQFQQLIDQDEVVEHNFFNGNYYGTLKEEVNKRLNAGKLVVMVIDVHGAANIRRMYPGATTIFLLPPPPRSWSAACAAAAPRPRRASGSAWRSPAMSWPSRINSPSSWSTTRWMPAPPDSMMLSASVRA